MPTETPDTFPALFWAYTVVWFVICVYVWSLGIRLGKIKNQIESSHTEAE